MVGTAVLKPSDSTPPPGRPARPPFPERCLSAMRVQCWTARALRPGWDPARCSAALSSYAIRHGERGGASAQSFAGLAGCGSPMSLPFEPTTRCFSRGGIAAGHTTHSPRFGAAIHGNRTSRCSTTDANSPDVERFLRMPAGHRHCPVQDAAQGTDIHDCDAGTFVMHPEFVRSTGTRTGVSGRSPRGIVARWA